jgi:chromosomal replication initiator protein
MVDAIWLEVRRRLQGSIPEKDYDTWIRPVQATRWADGELTLETPSGFFRDWLRRHFLPALEALVEEVSGGPARVAVVVNRALDVPARRAEPVAVVPVEAGAGARASERYTFDTFVVGESNRIAYGAARSVVAEPGGRFNPLFLYGGVGLGKTHLLNAVAQGLRSASRSGRVACLSAEQFVNEMIEALQRDRMERFRQRYRGIGTLVIDDIQFLADKRRSQEEFYHTFNALHDGRRQIVIASDRSPQQLPGIQEALRNRFASGLLAPIEPPDPALRLALVERKSATLGLTLDPETAAFVAEGWCENVRELEGALLRIEAFAHVAGRPVELGLVREVLGAPRRRGHQGSLRHVIAEVCEHFKVTHAELVSGRRTARLALPRQLAMYLCRRHTDVPLSRIGAELGGRDHSTIAHGLAAIERRLREDAELRRTVAALQARLRA